MDYGTIKAAAPIIVHWDSPLATSRPVTNPHNCYRCGRDFQPLGRERVCVACRASSRPKPLNPHLSFREEQVVNLVARAMLNKEIAWELHLTEGTVKEYMNRIFRKLGMSNRTQLAVWALAHKEAA